MKANRLYSLIALVVAFMACGTLAAIAQEANTATTSVAQIQTRVSPMTVVSSGSDYALTTNDGGKTWQVIAEEKGNEYVQTLAKTVAVANSQATSSPNPASGITTIKWESEVNDNVHVVLYDMQGSAVLTTNAIDITVGPQSITLDVSNLAVGNYYYRIHTGNSVAGQGRLVVAR